MLSVFRKSLHFCLILLFAVVISFSGISQVYCYESTASHQVLQKVLEHVAKTIEQEKSAMVVFDLDDTLFSPAMRMRQVLIDFAVNTPGVPADLKAKAEALNEETVCYEIDDTLKNMGITNKALIQKIKAFYSKEAFTSKYLKYDVPNPGAVEYVKALYSAGAKICYLTGRGENQMGEGTINALKDAGFPYGNTSSVLLLKRNGGSTTNFKKEELLKLMKNENIVASFDNEPANVNMMKATLGKECNVVYLNTRHSGNAAVVPAGIPAIKNFLQNK